MQHVLVYADSLSWGIIPDTRKRLSFEQRWPGVMEGKLNADGANVRAQAIGIAEDHPAAGERIERRRFDVRIAEGGDRVGPLVVGEQEQDVGPGRGTGRRTGPAVRRPPGSEGRAQRKGPPGAPGVRLARRARAEQ